MNEIDRLRARVAELEGRYRDTSNRVNGLEIECARLEKACAEEREACAKICSDVYDQLVPRGISSDECRGVHNAVMLIAAAIRARSIASPEAGPELSTRPRTS